MEVIVVDDHSEDNTTAVFNQTVKDFNNSGRSFQCITNKGTGKKAALSTGIAHASGSIILTTDADCRVPKTWISKTIEQFEESTHMLVGAVRISGTGFIDRLQQLEFASLIASGAASLANNLPTMANGANLAFRKSSFEAVKGYAGNAHIPSGDDEFLLRKMHQAFPDGVRFNAAPDAVVSTQGQESLSAFIQQRIRWASKWNLHPSIFSKSLALLVFMFQVSFLLSPWLMVGGWLSWPLGLALLTLKALGEAIFFLPVLRYLRINFYVPAFLFLQFIYPLYVVGIGLLANALGYRWKGRRYGSSQSAD